jgi:hypothetical protein
MVHFLANWLRVLRFCPGRSVLRNPKNPITTGHVHDRFTDGFVTRGDVLVNRGLLTRYREQKVKAISHTRQHADKHGGLRRHNAPFFAGGDPVKQPFPRVDGERLLHRIGTGGQCRRLRVGKTEVELFDAVAFS